MKYDNLIIIWLQKHLIWYSSIFLISGLSYRMFSLPTYEHIPTTPWVYIFRDNKKEILYVGKAKNLQKRLIQYFAPWSVWKQDMLNKAKDMEFINCQSEQEALLLESNLIKQHQPIYNRLLKWDNSYVYIKLSHHRFPQITLTRRKSDDWAIYIGPKSNTQELKKLLQVLRQYIQYRTCSDQQFWKGVLCNDYIFGLCKGRCIYAQHDKKEVLLSHDKPDLKSIEYIDKLLDQAKILWFDREKSYHKWSFYSHIK